MSDKPRQIMPSEKRREYILENGAALAKQISLENVNPRLVSAFCKINTSVATVRFYFNNADVLRKEIAKSRFYSKSR